MPRRSPRRPARLAEALESDSGVALVVSIALVGLVGILLVTMVAYGLRESGASGRDRQRSAAVSTAEGAVDLTLAQVQSAAPSALPCGVLPGRTVPVDPTDTMTVVTRVTYYDGLGAVVPCASVPTAPLATVRVVAESTSPALAGETPARRTMETLARLTPGYGRDLDKAIFGNAGVTLANQGEVFGQGGRPDADIYTNGSFRCANNQRYHGSVFAQGSITMAGTCTVDVDAYAGTGFRADNAGVTVTGRVLVSGGGASLVPNAQVGQQVRTSGSIAWDGCTADKCFPGSVVPAVPALAFPVLQWDSATEAEWAANGYTTVVSKNDCADARSSQNPGRWLLANASGLTGKTVLLTDCQLVIEGNSRTIELNNDLAVFARGGVAFRNSVTIRSRSGQQRLLHLVQPYDAVSTHPCTSDGILLDNQVTIEPTVDHLLYSPCNVTKRNNSTVYGQIYAGGSAVVDNRLTMYYRPVPVWGVTGTNSTVSSYVLDIQYKRETR